MAHNHTHPAPFLKDQGPWTAFQAPDFQTFMFDYSGRVNGTVSQKHAYLIRRNGIFYFSRRVPSELQTRFNKERVTISLRTRSQAKAEKSAEIAWTLGLNPTRSSIQ